MYFELYEMLHNFIYEGAVLTGWMEMTLTVLATIGVLFVFAIPFVLVWGCLRLVGWR